MAKTAHTATAAPEEGQQDEAPDITKSANFGVYLHPRSSRFSFTLNPGARVFQGDRHTDQGRVEVNFEPFVLKAGQKPVGKLDLRRMASVGPGGEIDPKILENLVGMVEANKYFEANAGDTDMTFYRYDDWLEICQIDDPVKKAQEEAAARKKERATRKVQRFVPGAPAPAAAT